MSLKERKKEIVITCPTCGYEYLPAEIYYPKSLLGNPSEIDRTPEGKIDIYDGASVNPVETFTCERCGSTFEVVVDMKFKTHEVVSTTFESEYTSPIYPNRISLPEDDLN